MRTDRIRGRLAAAAVPALLLAGCAAPAASPGAAPAAPASSASSASSGGAGAPSASAGALPSPAPGASAGATAPGAPSGLPATGTPGPAASGSAPVGPKALAGATFPARVGDYTRQGGETPGRDGRSATYTAWHVTIHARLQSMPFDSAVGVLDQARRAGALVCGLDLAAGSFTCLAPMLDGSLRVDSASVQSVDILLGFSQLLYATFP